jgi:hypothetical protein
VTGAPVGEKFERVDLVVEVFFLGGHGEGGLRALLYFGYSLNDLRLCGRVRFRVQLACPRF